METSKILTASLLDLLFDNRNKDYGAYELRKTYRERIIKSLLITVTISGLAYAGALLANAANSSQSRYRIKPEVTIQTITDPKVPEKIPEPPKHTEPPQVRTEIFTPPKIMPNDEISKPLPTQDELDSSRISLIKTSGIADIGTTDVNKINDENGVIENTKPQNNEPFTTVQIEARYTGNWENFLRRNLRPEVPVDNGAPAGRYTIIIQFIVDVDGTISAITPVTHLGYGMEEEAIRVLKKADKWEPAFQNGIHVKAYRRQPITFEVMTDD